jgi:hypothetical protein
MLPVLHAAEAAVVASSGHLALQYLIGAEVRAAAMDTFLLSRLHRVEGCVRPPGDFQEARDYKFRPVLRAHLCDSRAALNPFTQRSTSKPVARGIAAVEVVNPLKLIEAINPMA